MRSIPAIPAKIPQLQSSKGVFARFGQYDIRRYCFFYLGYQILKDSRFHLHTGVHYITVHNVSVLNISKNYRSNHGRKNTKASL
jgi:hypothetical protein